MKKLIALFVSLIAINILVAQTLTSAGNLNFKPSTGDTEMDGVLTQVHNNAVKDINTFQNNVVSAFNVPKDQVVNALKDLPAGDVYMAAQVANITTRPFVQVVDAFKKDKGKGWGVIAKELGIKPGSPEFHKMKKEMKARNEGPGSNGKGNGKGKDKDKGKGNKDDKGKGNKGGGKKDKGEKDTNQDSKPATDKPASGTPSNGRG